MKIWEAAGVHGRENASQTGCKLVSYTQVGMTHVISYLILALVIYAYISLKKADFNQVDTCIRRNIGWIFCAIFAVEGIFGMVPAIYMDVNVEGSKVCVFLSFVLKNYTYFFLIFSFNQII